MNWLYRLAAWFLSRDAESTCHCIHKGRLVSGWIYGRHGWYIDMPKVTRN